MIQEKELDILIIEDDLRARFIWRLALEEGQLNGNVNEAMNGQEALDIITAAGKAPDLILLDLHMPVMNGFQFLEAFKSSELYNKNTHIYVLTEDDNRENLKRIMGTGMVKNYFPKPLTENHARQLRNDLSTR